jgi:S1-C subfamily serine protease
MASRRERLESMRESSAERETVSVPVGGALPAPRTRMERAAAEDLADSVRAGVIALDKLRDRRERDLSEQEVQGLEAIVRLEGRPAILIQDGSFMEPPKLWAALKDARQHIDASIARVGRIEVSGHPDFEWVGTGSLVGDAIVMTNEHVAHEFSRQQNGGFEFRPGRGAALDLLAEFGSAATRTFKVVEIVGIHSEHDLALLRVEPTSADATLPEPIEVSAAEPSDLMGRQVYVIGYPAWDGRRNDPEPMRKIFLDIYNVKRLQPGEVRSTAPVGTEIHHDCSTLGGNSGSPVFDLQTHRVIGLHFGGQFQRANSAVPLWTLVDDPLLRDRVRFVA